MKIKKVHQLTGHNASVYALAQGLRAGTFLSAAGDGWVVEWGLDNPDLGKLIAKTDTQIFSLATLAAYDTLVVGDMNGGVHWLYPNDDRPNKHIAHHRRGTYGLLQRGERLYSIGGDGVITVWDIAEARTIESLQISNQALRSILAHPTRAELLIGSSDNGIYRLDVDVFQLIGHQAQAHSNSVFALLHHPQQPDVLISGGRDAMLNVWNTTDVPWQLLQSQPAHWFTINALLSSPDGRFLLTASRDKTIRVWDATDFTLLRTLDAVRDGGHVNSVNQLLWLPNTPHFASTGDDRAIVIWEMG